MLNSMREAEIPATTSRPKGPKQKHPISNDGQWQPLSEVSRPLPEQFEVNLRLGNHPKTGAPQWFGFYTHGRESLKVVCDPYPGHELSKGGEVWAVLVTKQIPGIVFAKAETSPALAQRLAEKKAQAAIELKAFCLQALNQPAELSIWIPDNSQEREYAEVWNRVDHYTGKLVRWEEIAEGVIEVELEDVDYRRSQSDTEGGFEGRTKFHSLKKAFTLYESTVEDRSRYSHETYERYTYKALCGSNPGRYDWDALSWRLRLNN